MDPHLISQREGAAMADVFKLLNENTGVFMTAYGMLLTVLVVVVPALSGKKIKDLESQLQIKDATIENLRMQLHHASTKLAETDGYKKRASDEQERNQVMVDGLHKRISELEARQPVILNQPPPHPRESSESGGGRTM